MDKENKIMKKIQYLAEGQTNTIHLDAGFFAFDISHRQTSEHHPSVVRTCIEYRPPAVVQIN